MKSQYINTLYEMTSIYMLNARLYDQEKARGAVANDLEFVVERVMQQFKRVTGRHITTKVEAHFVQQFLLGQSLERLIREYPHAKNLQAILGRNGRSCNGPLYDTAHNGILLLGAGVHSRKLDPVYPQRVITAITAAVPHEEDATLMQWTYEAPGNIDIMYRSYAHMNTLVHVNMLMFAT